MLVVAGIFYVKFGWEMVVATAVTVVSYIWLTRTITEWRTKLRAQMNDLDGLALARAVDSLLNYETGQVFRRREARARTLRPGHRAPTPRLRSRARTRSACSISRRRRS
jgi:ATP-binding cassette subfamily B protein